MSKFENLSQYVKDYFNAWSNKDIKSLSYMMSEEVQLTDWNISDCRGREAVLSANQNIFDEVKNLSVEVHELSHNNNTVFCQLTIGVENEKIPVVDIIKFDKNSKIKSITAYRGN